MNDYEHQKLIWGGNDQLNCKFGGKMALSVYESNTNQRFVTSLIKKKKDGDVSATIFVIYTVCWVYVFPPQIEWFFDCSKSISSPAALINWVLGWNLALLSEYSVREGVLK